jgi:phenylpyruvate tautomerase PptA (4-oxalocrotonate tautomerase family)
MPTVIIEGPPLMAARKRRLVSALTRLICLAYRWPASRLIIVFHENRDENVARGGRLLSDQTRRTRK